MAESKILNLKLAILFNATIERLFSTAAEILSNERKKLKPEKALKLLFLKENLSVVEFQNCNMPKSPPNIRLAFSVGFGEFQDSVLGLVTGFGCTLVFNQHVNILSKVQVTSQKLNIENPLRNG